MTKIYSRTYLHGNGLSIQISSPDGPLPCTKLRYHLERTENESSKYIVRGHIILKEVAALLGDDFTVYMHAPNEYGHYSSLWIQNVTIYKCKLGKLSFRAKTQGIVIWLPDKSVPPNILSYFTT